MPIVSGGGAGGGAQTVLSASVTLTNAQIKALPTTAVQIVAAPAAGTVLLPIYVAMRLARTADYTNIAVTSMLGVHVGQDAFLALNETPDSGVSGLLAFGSDTGIWGFPGEISGAFSDSGLIDSEIVAQAVTLTAFNTGDFTGGNAANSLKVTVAYFSVSV